VDNKGHILAPCVLAAVNVHDSKLFPKSLSSLTDTVNKVGMNLFGSFLTLDSGFYGEYNQKVIEDAGMIPVIKPNHRNTKAKNIIKEREAPFADMKSVYRMRFSVERTFAWEDKYRRLVVRYEKKQETAYGFRLLAASLVNFREGFGRET
jgi:transposase